MFITRPSVYRLDLAHDAFTRWAVGKTVVQNDSHVVAWFAQAHEAEKFCDFMNNKPAPTFTSRLKNAINCFTR